MTINFNLLSHFIRHFFSAKRKGHGVHSPFAYRLCEDVFYNSDTFYCFNALQKLRRQLEQDETTVEITDFGAGSKTMKGRQRKIKDIATKGISSLQQSELLYRLMNFMNCRTAIELGTSIGLNTLYMASTNAECCVISIEGSNALSAYARELARKQRLRNIEFVCARFDEALPGVLAKMDQLDFIYIDGNHTEEATWRYFEFALAKKHNNSLFVFDDIYWSQGMTKAWERIKQHPEVRLSIDLFYFGLVFFKEEIKEKTELKLYI
jgi:predicted O-methyltransferase YrrM